MKLRIALKIQKRGIFHSRFYKANKIVAKSKSIRKATHTLRYGIECPYKQQTITNRLDRYFAEILGHSLEGGEWKPKYCKVGTNACSLCGYHRETDYDNKTIKCSFPIWVSPTH